MKRVLLPLILGILISLIPFFIYGIVVDWVAGEVSYSHYKSNWKSLDVGMDLVPGDMVKTGLESETILKEGDSEIHILENTTFSISERYEDEAKKSSLMLFLGRMKFKLGKSSKEEPEIRTQTINLTIRGTEFEVGSGFDGSTIVLMKDGSLAVQGKTSELLLEEGEGTEVAFGEEPSEKFEVITRVIDWDQWFDLSKKAVKGKELPLLKKVLERFREIDNQIREYEIIREETLKEKEEFLAERDRYIKEGKDDLALESSRKAGGRSKMAFHSIVNIRFLALSSIGLYDMSSRIYKSVKKPTKELAATFKEIKGIYKGIKDRYIRAGDRKRLERKERRGK